MTTYVDFFGGDPLLFAQFGPHGVPYLAVGPAVSGPEWGTTAFGLTTAPLEIVQKNDYSGPRIITVPLYTMPSDAQLATTASFNGRHVNGHRIRGTITLRREDVSDLLDNTSYAWFGDISFTNKQTSVPHGQYVYDITANLNGTGSLHTLAIGILTVKRRSSA